ncbi:hypothetical protein ACI65C_004962 [Semiaphis heraclei]
MTRELNSNPETVDEQWKIIKHTLGNVSEKVLGKARRTEKPWFNAICQEALERRKIARERWLNDTNNQEEERIFRVKRKECVIGNKNTKHYFTFIGQCKDSLFKISGWSDDKPSEDDEIWRINICAEPPKKSKLLHTSKRQCKGVEREEVSKLLLHNVPSNWQREKVDKICNFGDKIPPHVYGNHVLRAASVMQHSVTTKINAYFLIDFGKNMFKLCSTFPIWSNVMMDLFGCPNITASSAPIESDFNNLKNRILKNESKPMKVDRFVVTHLNSLNGSMKIAQDKIIHKKHSLDKENQNAVVDKYNRDDEYETDSSIMSSFHIKDNLDLENQNAVVDKYKQDDEYDTDKSIMSSFHIKDNFDLVIRNEYHNLLSPNMKILGTKCFSKEILETEIHKYISTRLEQCKSCCNYMEIMHEVEPHVFIEVDLLGYYGNAKCKISSIPTAIMINKKQFDLLGIVNFIGNSILEVDQTLGHYTAYIKRSNNWELHDDLKKKTSRVSQQEIINPHILIYVETDWTSVGLNKLADTLIKENNLGKTGSINVKYGQDTVLAAFEKYLELNEVEVLKAGLVIHCKTIWGCPCPGGLVLQNGEIYKILEIKCPISCKNEQLIEINVPNLKYLHIVKSKIELKRSYLHNTQVQLLGCLPICDLPLKMRSTRIDVVIILNCSISETSTDRHVCIIYYLDYWVYNALQ